jgi:hypothetical protein
MMIFFAPALIAASSSSPAPNELARSDHAFPSALATNRTLR